MEKATIYDFARMCKGNNGECKYCPLGSNNNKKGITCDQITRKYPNEANEIILKWCKEHPAKIRQSEFLKMFPNARTDSDGVIDIAPCTVEKGRYISDCCSCPREHGFSGCSECCKEFWLAEVDEHDK